MPIFDHLLSSQGYVLLDGSMGTELFARGLVSGTPPELWNLEQPAQVAAVHRAYVDAGSDVVLTNSFGGTSFRLALHALDDRVDEVNRLAASLARGVADAVSTDEGRSVLVAGSMGPTGELLEPLGAMTAQACRDAFSAQAEGLAGGGADLLWIETMSAVEEVEAAVAGARSATDLPICATLSFDTNGRTMMGVTGRRVAEVLGPLGLAAVGANCGNNLADSELALAEIRAVDPELVVIGKCNAGIPEWRDGELRYNAGPDTMSAHGHRLRDLGVGLIGACCGSTPDHLAMMKEVLDGAQPVPDVAEQEPSAVAVGRVDGSPERSRPRRRRPR